MHRPDVKLGSAFVLAGICFASVVEYVSENVGLAVGTFVLCVVAAGIVLYFRRRSEEHEQEPAIATLFGGSVAGGSSESFRHDYDLPLNVPSSSGSGPQVQPVAELLIDYSHNECDAGRLRNMPLLIKNVTVGTGAFNVRIRPVQSPHNKLLFMPETIRCIAGGDQAEMVPQMQQIAGERPKAALNQLPDFIGGFYNPSGRHDLQALNEVYEEKPLLLEIEYESGGKQLVSECELLYTQWHKNIRMGKHEIRVLAKSAVQ